MSDDGAEAEPVEQGRRRGRPPPEADRYERFVRSHRYRWERAEKARVIVELCRDRLQRAHRAADLGAGTGLVKKEIEERTGTRLIGIEIDRSFVVHRERMVAADVCRLPLPEASLDFAVVNHLYEHVSDQPGLFRELYRVLVPGGEAYLSAGNRLAVLEPHYRLPFLSWLPRPLADLYLRLTGRGRSYEGIRFRTRPTLIAMIRDAGFRVRDETRRALDELLETTWGRGWERLWRGLSRLPASWIDALLRSLSPQWFLFLEKPEASRGAGGEGPGDPDDPPGREAP